MKTGVTVLVKSNFGNFWFVNAMPEDIRELVREYGAKNIEVKNWGDIEVGDDEYKDIVDILRGDKR